VLRVAHELGYVPHGIAKALREGTSRIVLLGLPPGIHGGSLDGFLSGLDAELTRHDHMLLVRHGSLEPVVAAVSPRGVIDLSDLYHSDSAPDDGGWVDGLAAHSMVQLRHLAEAGHTAVAMALPDDPAMARVSDARLRYAGEAAAMLGLAPLTTFTVGSSHHPPAVTAIAAFDDRVALRLLAALRADGVTVPDDIAVMGFDDIGYGEFTTPALTSVRIDADSFGRRAARVALGLDAADVVPPAATVVVRESA
jgi:DNA-binding LacI/PurR family transcriptional regulator